MVRPLNSFTKPKYLGMLNSPSITKTSIIKDMKKKKSKRHEKRRMGKNGKIENWKTRQGYKETCIQIGSFSPFITIMD